MFFTNEYAQPMSDAPHVVIHLYEISRNQYSTGNIGNRRFISNGRVNIHIYDILNKGTKNTDVIHQALRDEIESTTVGLYIIDTLTLAYQETIDKYLHSMLQFRYRDYETK